MAAFIDEFADEMSDTLTCTPGTLTATGSFVASGAVLNLASYIEASARLVRDSRGQEVVSSVQAIVAPNNLSVEGYRFTLPATFNPRINLRAIAIEKISDEDGPCYEEVMLP